MATITKYQTKTGETRYSCKVYLGTDATGKKRQQMKRGFTSELDARHWSELARVEARKNGLKGVAVESMTFNDVFSLWYEYYKTTVKGITANQTRKMILNHAVPLLGAMKVSEITPPVIQRSITQWMESAPKSWNTIYMYVHTVIKYAVTLDIIDSDPFQKIIKPKTRTSELMSVEEEEQARNYWTQSEMRLFLDAIKSHDNPMYGHLFHLLAYTGVRIGELLALQWVDVNFTDNTISINKTVTRTIEGKITIGTPKTHTSSRKIMLDKHTGDTLRKWKTEQAKQMLMLGFNVLQNKNQLVFPSANNLIMSPQLLQIALDNTCTALGIHRITLHGFRHTHATMLLEAGATFKDIQTRLGHRDIQTTMNLYAHTTDKLKRETADLFANYIEKC